MKIKIAKEAKEFILKMHTPDKKGPMQYIYYMTELEDSPCQICFVRPLCSKSFIEGSACDLFTEFIEKKEKEMGKEK